VVMVVEEFRRGGTPAAARTAVRARDSRTHAGAIRKFNASVVRFGSTS
jgi:hypothetical protein